MKITMVHGSGGNETAKLITGLFVRHLGNPILARLEDSAVIPGSSRIAMTTDSFVVTPLFFPGGDIGKLAVCGTINDLSMSGATPKYLTCGFILEEGAEYDALERIVCSMAEAAKEAEVLIVAGDTKVVEGNGGIYINTAGVGLFPDLFSGMPDASCNKISGEPPLGAMHCKAGDVILLSGNLGDHHATILSARMNISNTIRSDCAPLDRMTRSLLESGARVRAMRDVTRGGLATVLHEIAEASSCGIRLHEERIPVSDAVRGFCGILGLDPLYMANEGKMIAVVDPGDASLALRAMKESRYGQDASIIGEITGEDPGKVLLHTSIGGIRTVPELYGEGLPRIC